MKVTLPVHGVTEKNMSSLGSDSEHGYLDTNEMLPVITETLPGITNKDNIDHAYHRQPSHTEAPPFQDYATTEDEDNAIDALLQLSESQVATDIILGDNSTLLPIGANLPDTAPMNISLDTEAVTAAIENIALEETVAQTSLTEHKKHSHTQRENLNILKVTVTWILTLNQVKPAANRKLPLLMDQSPPRENSKQ